MVLKMNRDHLSKQQQASSFCNDFRVAGTKHCLDSFRIQGDDVHSIQFAQENVYTGFAHYSE
jgi:hypothetical protein